MTILLELMFFLSILLCLSTYCFYPMIVLLVGRVFPFRPSKTDIIPTVSILISAYNEEKDIRKKLQNTLKLDYPKEKIEIFIGSDGSTDKTAQILGDYLEDGVKVLDFKQNRGKTAVQNDLVSASRNEILIFTDAASFLREDSLRNLVKPFSDSRVGAVAGCMEFIKKDQNLTTQSQGLYWKYEMKLREAESTLGRLVGVDGPLYAVRRDTYVPLASNIISDLITPLLVLKQGRRVVLERNAVVLEEPTTKSGDEFNTRRRITLRGLIGIFSEPKLISIFHFPLLAMQIFFHKLLRWGVGFLVMLNLLICIVLSKDVFFSFFLHLHMAFYLAAFLGWILEKSGRSLTVFKVPYYFCLVNLAATMGILDFLRRRQAVSWKPVRH